jgi:type I restriction enzyme M protein
METPLTQTEVNAAAWAACDTFRGVIDPAQYKDYILAALFLKYISDLWNDHKQQYGSDQERFVLPIVEIKETDDGPVKETFLADFHSLYLRRTEPNVGEILNTVLDQIEKANKVKLGGVFRNIDFNSLTNAGRAQDRNRHIKSLLEDFNKLDLRPSFISEDVVCNTYSYLIERFASSTGKKAGQFYTPKQVSRLLARLARPKAGDRICDPACGSGSLLIEAANVIEETGSKDYALFGQEACGATWAMARMNMFLHGKDGARIELADTLSSPALVENDRLMKFNVVLANPPFSLGKWGAEDAASDPFNRFWRGVPPKSRGDYAFLSHMIEAALPHQGRVAVVVPHGVLFRGGAEGRIRQKLLEENLLDTIVGLPPNLFPTTSIPAAILVFDRSREKGGEREDVRDVLFIDASREFVSGKTRNILSQEHFRKIISTFEARNSVEKYAHLATPQEIAENEFNLNIPRYVGTFETEEIDVRAIQREIDRLEGELAVVRRRTKEYLKELGGL